MTADLHPIDVDLNDGTTIPQLGYGVWRVPDDEAQPAVEEALRVGYRLIDTAAIYGNERGVGRAIAASGIAREDIYLTTKLWNADQGYDTTLRAHEASLKRLAVDTIDLYLIHWAAPPLGKYVDTWKALVHLHEQGAVGSIGVSNFHAPHLQEIIDATGVTPVLNQVECHPYLQIEQLRAWNAAHQIATQAWSPLGAGKGMLEDPVLTEIAERRDATPAQVVLAWHIAQGNVVIPKSVTPSRIAENWAALAVQLEPEDIDAIEGLERGERTGGNPDTADYAGPTPE
ncbi:aldo/keto reductase [Pseudactinotalea suaedae]|uniref:aldo/keto reductase n=1 Tax=Pseudactinotalea suaedae TaxID=1524924 RepID=UPI0012E21312|nr:aldo/keto reductase [Pseudactinotalea suaedae]